MAARPGIASRPSHHGNPLLASEARSWSGHGTNEAKTPPRKAIGTRSHQLRLRDGVLESGAIDASDGSSSPTESERLMAIRVLRADYLPHTRDAAWLGRSMLSAPPSACSTTPPRRYNGRASVPI
ncbi:hypothetical protein G7Z17_g6902 [Cylindrodendrum hubeiense]|uniref:Uncharacterized protein n=1 Tax=Cylindrodendrum hubeiense TaxID=595255 RepID=A0A9P5HA25_9HYPO|nr:hypothetical protein G7Z17_g6902 [Cylindrodendrum hubeiense]